MKLNVDRIDFELYKIGKDRSWLAEKMGFTRQWISYLLKDGNNTTLKTIEKIATALSINPKDLII